MKQTLQNRFPRRWLLLAFVLNFAIAAAALLPYMIRDGGLLLVAADFDAEQLSYNMLCNNAIKSGEVREVARVVKGLMHRDASRGLSTVERKMLRSAKQILLSEMMLVEDLSYDGAEQLLSRSVLAE